MARTPPHRARTCPISWAFIVGIGAAAAAIFVGCSGGESGLVLGQPEAQLVAGTGGSPSAAGTAATAGISQGGSFEIGGTAPASAGEVSGGAPDAAAGSGPTIPSDPPWVDSSCTPTVDFSNNDTTTQGALFTNAVPDPAALVQTAAHAACRTLYRDGSEVKSVPSISFVVEDYAGIASTAGNMVRLSTRYLKMQSDAGVDLRLEITGVLHFAVSLVYQNQGSSMDSAPPGWLVVGIADFVRLESGYLSRAARAKGGSYDSNSQATAFFLDYLATKNPDVVYQLNQHLSPASPVWSNDVFMTVMGLSLDVLWADYQATL